MMKYLKKYITCEIIINDIICTDRYIYIYYKFLFKELYLLILKIER